MKFVNHSLIEDFAKFAGKSILVLRFRGESEKIFYRIGFFSAFSHLFPTILPMLWFDQFRQLSTLRFNWQNSFNYSPLDGVSNTVLQSNELYQYYKKVCLPLSVRFASFSQIFYSKFASSPDLDPDERMSFWFTIDNRKTQSFHNGKKGN